ncbi:MAG: hypothetical protein GXP08_06625 [Gammaproteobacteria bacterium]|nr:hypothetical protein [Gammaproteobacteria bacterium]
MKVAAPAHPCACGISASLHVIEAPAVIKKILDYLKKKAEKTELTRC